MKKIITFFMCMLYFLSAHSQVTTLISAGSTWKYLANGSNQGTTWRSSAFNDASWQSGPAELGYGDGDEATVVGYGPNSSAKYITTYFRKTFNVTNPASYPSYTLKVKRDDGIIVYINGTQVYKTNLPSGTIGYKTLASAAISGTDESAWKTVTLNYSPFLNGSNIMAVEIHQNAASSTDISFDASLTASTNTVAPPALTRGPYLQKLTPNGITIRWRTDIKSNSKIKYGTTLMYGDSVSNGTDTTEHILAISGLTPGTKYYYTIGSSTIVLQGDAENNFYTAPVSGSSSPFRVWIIGDFGQGTGHQSDVRNSYVNYTGSTPTNLWLWLGDNAYQSGTDAEFQSKVFNIYPNQFKKFPLFPSPGNHDYGPATYQSASALTTNFPYFSIFSVPTAGESGGVASGSPKYYSYNYANTHFISLDSYGALNTSTSAMYTWLNNDLAANTQRWTVVYFHHPPYTLGGHNSDTNTECIKMRTNIIPLLENFHVDLVLSGHSHNLERSYLMKGHYGLSSTFTSSMKVSNATNSFVKTPPFDGTIYAVCGTSGSNPEGAAPGYPMPCMFYSNNVYNASMVLDISGDILSAKYLTAAGVVVDQFTIQKSSLIQEPGADERPQLFSLITEDNQTIINYTLEEDSQVKIDLLNELGQSITTFDDVPENQGKGFYQYDLHLNEKVFSSGIYFVRMSVNGKTIIKSTFIGK